MFLTYFHLIYNCSAFVAIKKIDKCLFIGWSGTVFIFLANIFKYTFHLFINNTVREPIIDESLFHFLIKLMRV